MASDGEGLPPGRASIGKALELAFGTMRDNPLVTFGSAFLLGALPGALLQYFVTGTIQAANLADSDAFVGYVSAGAGSYILALFLGLLVQTVLVRATIAHANGERAGLAESLTDGIAVILPLLGLFILMILALIVGFVLLIVPGIMLYTMWYVAVPALVAERQGVFTAFSRSRFLTKGVRWRIFGLLVILILISWALGAVLGFTMLASGELPGVVQARPSASLLILTTLISTVTSTIGATVAAAVYVQLRNWKDGPDSTRLEDIFS